MSSPAPPVPAVSVLMATYNGRRWLPEQVDSILGQQGVDVRLVVSDDGSSDGSWEWLTELATREPRVRLLERVAPSGSARANFYRLLREAETGDDLVALADQDDVWQPGKLAAQAALLAAGGLDAVSSDVTAVDDRGHRVLLRKSNPQRRFDYLFESAGPGSTFVLSPRLAALVRAQLSEPASQAAQVEAHDWLIYAICRAAGWVWAIQGIPWVDYRQHGGNELGANRGLGSALWRLRRITAGWHRRQALLVTRVALRVCTDPARRAELERLCAALADRGVPGRVALLRSASQFRRHPRDRAFLAALIALGVW